MCWRQNVRSKIVRFLSLLSTGRADSCGGKGRKRCNKLSVCCAVEMEENENGEKRWRLKRIRIASGNGTKGRKERLAASFCWSATQRYHRCGWLRFSKKKCNTKPTLLTQRREPRQKDRHATKNSSSNYRRSTNLELGAGNQQMFCDMLCLNCEMFWILHSFLDERGSVARRCKIT